MVYAPCPNCQSNVPLTELKVGNNVHCPGCGVGLKIVWLLPVELDMLNESEIIFNNMETNFLGENDIKSI
jgi:uncharacterized paraquat-inducible protein A